MSAVILKTIQVVQGARLVRNLQCLDLDGTIPTTFNTSATLTCKVWLAQGQPPVILPACTWFNAAMCQVTLTITEAQSAQLSIDTIYNVQVFATQGGGTFAIAMLYLQVLPAASTQASPTPPDLISGAYAAQMLAVINLNEAQLEQVPTLITACSNAIRGYCNRDFLRLTRSVVTAVELDGTVRLGNPPINKVYRVQNQPEIALTITNTAATSAWVSFETTGGLYLQGSGTADLAPTGVVLNWQSGGTTNEETIEYTASETIAGLATAINTFGGGWGAVADPVLGLWPVTEIFDWQEGKGAGPNDLPDGCAQYRVFSSNVTDHRPVPDAGDITGIWWVGRNNADLGGDGRWGPDAPYWGALSQQVGQGRVKVVYDGGPNSVPFEVMSITAELLKIVVSRFQTDLLLESENAGEYAYKISLEMVAALPKHVKQTLARYRISYA